jgi:hypothetical protein
VVDEVVDVAVVVDEVVVVVVLAYTSTLLLAQSATQRLPDESKATPTGPSSPVAVVKRLLVVKLFWPITREADSPVLNEGVYSRTLLLP